MNCCRMLAELKDWVTSLEKQVKALEPKADEVEPREVLKPCLFCGTVRWNRRD